MTNQMENDFIYFFKTGIDFEFDGGLIYDMKSLGFFFRSLHIVKGETIGTFFK